MGRKEVQTMAVLEEIRYCPALGQRYAINAEAEKTAFEQLVKDR